MVSVKLLGGVSLQSEGGVLSGPATQRHRLALLALLAAAYPHAVPRDKLVACLWPERDAGHARNLLNQAVHALRRTLGEGALLSAGDELRFDPGAVEVDVVAFEQAAREDEFERVVGLYTGPFLDGFFLPESTEFEQWVEGERERLRRVYGRALEELAAATEAKGDHLGAAEWWTARAVHDPYDSRVALRLMQSLDAGGNRAGALQHAAIHQRLLQEEFEVEPPAELRSLAERIRADTADASAPLVRPPELAPAAASVVETPPAGSDGGRETVSRGERRGRGAGFAPAAAPRSWRRLMGVAVALLGLVFAGWLAVNTFGRKTPDVRRLAVLPLANLTGDPRQDYFVAGMHDALVAELAQIGDLTVYSRQSVLRYQGSDLPLRAIARELGVDAIVEGSVFQTGDSVRITVQLVRARPEEHLWAASHQGSLSNALALQGEVANAIARAIHARVAPEVERRLTRGHAVAPAAQEAYLKGLYHLERASYGERMSRPMRLEEQRTAIRYLEQAVALDSTWAAAHAKLALAYHWLASGFRSDNAEQVEIEAEFYPKSNAAASRALALDETESQAHASLGFVRLMYEWDWGGAERAIRRAMELDPNSHHWIYARYLQAAGRHEEAITHYRMAEERNPLSEPLKHQVVQAYACADRYDEAIAQARELHARVGPSGRTGVVGDTLWLLSFASRYYAMKGSHAEAIATAEALVALTDTLTSGSGLAFAYAMAGRRDEARALAERIESHVRARGGIWRPAQLYAALGDTGRALDMVEASLEGRRSLRVTFRCSLTYALLRDEPRMRALVRQVGFAH